MVVDSDETKVQNGGREATAEAPAQNGAGQKLNGERLTKNARRRAKKKEKREQHLCRKCRATKKPMLRRFAAAETK